MEKNKTKVTKDDLVKYQNEYSDEKFWDKAKKFAVKLGGNATYYALVLYYVLQSPDVTVSNKALILGALGYFILPLDLIPDVIPALGFTLWNITVKRLVGLSITVATCSSSIVSLPIRD